MEDVVQGYLWLTSRVKEFLNDRFLSILEVSSSLHNIPKALIGQFKAGNWGATSVFRISDILYDKCLMIDYCTCSEPLNHKLPWLFIFILIFWFFFLKRGSLVVGD